MDLSSKIRDVPDFPKKGILFKDITTLLKDPEAFRLSVDQMAQKMGDPSKIDVIVGTESRGFIFASALAYKLNVGLVPVRKKGKLPAETIASEYQLEYGTDTLEIHKDAIRKNQRVVVVDDLLATGGTIKATCDLVERSGGLVQTLVFLIELTFLEGRKQLGGREIISLIRY